MLWNINFTNVIKSFLSSVFIHFIISLILAHVSVVQLAARQTGGPLAQMFLSFLLLSLPRRAQLPPSLVSCCFFNALSQSGGTYVVTHFPSLAFQPSLEIVPHKRCKLARPNGLLWILLSHKHFFHWQLLFSIWCASVKGNKEENNKKNG